MKNTIPLQLHVPEPASRPGDAPNFGGCNLSEPGAVARPDIATPPFEMRDLAYSLIRVLDNGGNAVGPWKPAIDVERLRHGLKTMIVTRHLDDQMFRTQRAGKTSFYMKSTGEEAVGAAQALALDFEDMCFTSYRQQAILVSRGYPLVKMMNQVFSNAGDPVKGRQLPVCYSAKDYGYFTVSANLATQYPQAVGWAMASAYKGDSRIAATWIGDGATAEGDFHNALTFAAVYRAPVILNIVNNQWAISSFAGIAGGDETTFAARGIGYGLPALRVDGNDFLAVYAATEWAVERARANLGATVIELYTYRAASHSTSDDPSRYRPTDEPEKWPLGDPIERLKDHLISLKAWSQAEHDSYQAEAAELVLQARREAEAIGTLQGGAKPPPKTMFEDVFKEPDWRLRRQRQEAGF